MTQRQWRDLGLILLLALALRLALWWFVARGQWVSDEAEYLAAATWLAQGRGFSFYAEWPWLRPPLYLIFLAPLICLFGVNLVPIRLAQVILSLTVPALVYLLARTAVGRRVALVAGVIAALWLPLAMLPHLVLAENLFLPLLLAAVCCLTHWQKTRQRRRLLAGGALLGLAALTRGMTIGFLPLAVLWVAVWSLRSAPAPPQGQEGTPHLPIPHSQKRLQARQALLNSLLLTGAALALILPWSGYNWLRYGRPILVDTTGGYNFWLGTQGGQAGHLRAVRQTLLDLPDPVSRQAYAYRQGWEVLSEDPGAFLGSRLAEVVQLWQINYSADERLVSGFVLGEVSTTHLLMTFFLDDSAYVFLVTVALYGLLLKRGEAGRGLILLWLVYNLILAGAFFAISRFRLALLPFLAIYAAVVLARGPLSQLFPKRPLRPADDSSFGAGVPTARRLVAAGILVAIFWIIVLPTYLGLYPASTGATYLGLRGRHAAKHLARAEQALAAGDLEQAEEELPPALNFRPDGVHPVVTAQVGLAELLRAQGDLQAALAELDGLDWYQAALLRGDILRAQGNLEGARAQFSTREVNQRNPTGWAWTHLQPPASAEIDLGGGLDLGLVDGFYLGEQEGAVTYRWSGPEARLRFPGAGQGQALTLRLRLRGWRPAGEAPAEVSVSLEGNEIARFQAPSEWDEISVSLPAVPEGEDIVLSLRATTFLPGPRDLLETERLRLLGVMVDWAEVTG